MMAAKTRRGAGFTLTEILVMLAIADGHIKWQNPQSVADMVCYLKTALP